MKEQDRELIGELRELCLLLKSSPVFPERRYISDYLLYQQRIIQARVVNKAIDRILTNESMAH